MEISIGGHGFRVTINSYMAAEAATLSKIAHWKNDNQAQALETEAADQRKHVQIFMGPQSGISKSTVC